MIKITKKIEMYECKAHLIVIDKDKVKELHNKLVKRHKSQYEEFGEEVWGECLSFFDNYYIILTNESFKDYNTFFHELNHLITMILTERDIYNDETSSYLSGYLGDFFLTKIKHLFDENLHNKKRNS